MLPAQLARATFEHHPKLTRSLAVEAAGRFPAGKRVAEVS